MTDEGGATVAEFAVLTMVLFLLIFGVIDGSRILSTWIIITNEAREAARYGSVSVTDPILRDPQQLATLEGQIDSYARSRIAGLLDVSSSYLQVSSEVGGSPVLVNVAIVYRLPIVTPLIQSVLSDTLTLQAQSAMRAEEN